MQSDSYQATGCYNLLCSGFVQMNSRIAIGAAISPISSFSTNQFDVTILIWKVCTKFMQMLINSDVFLYKKKNYLKLYSCLTYLNFQYFQTHQILRVGDNKSFQKKRKDQVIINKIVKK